MSNKLVVSHTTARSENLCQAGAGNPHIWVSDIDDVGVDEHETDYEAGFGGVSRRRSKALGCSCFLRFAAWRRTLAQPTD